MSAWVEWLVALMLLLAGGGPDEFPPAPPTAPPVLMGGIALLIHASGETEWDYQERSDALSKP